MCSSKARIKRFSACKNKPKCEPAGIGHQVENIWTIKGKVPCCLLSHSMHWIQVAVLEDTLLFALCFLQ